MPKLEERPLTPFPTNTERIENECKELSTIEELSETVMAVRTSNIKNSKLFINTYITLKGKINGGEINTFTIIHILKLSMELVETLDSVNGEDQRDFAVSLVREIIDKSNLSTSQKENCLIVIDLGILDNVVDFVVDASIGKININKVKKSMSKIFPCCK